LAISYPPVPPTISGDIESINRFLKDPTFIMRYLRTVAQQRFIGDVLLSNRFTTTSGSVLYEQNEDIYAGSDPEPIAPGAEYQETQIPTGPAAVASTVKWGQKFSVTDEAISRMNFNPVQKGLLKMANRMVWAFDNVCLSAIVSAVTQTQTASVAWSAGAIGQAGGPNIFRDVQTAVATIRAHNQGYEANMMAIDDQAYADLISDPQISLMLARESENSPIHVGTSGFPVIGGVTILPTPNIPVANTGIVLDSSMLGGIVTENIVGPGWTSVPDLNLPIQAKTLRHDERDSWSIQTRRVATPIVQEPLSAVLITGIGV